MKRNYFVSAACENNDGVQLSIGMVAARGQEGAKFIAKTNMIERFRPTDGWRTHCSCAAELSSLVREYVKPKWLGIVLSWML